MGIKSPNNSCLPRVDRAPGGTGWPINSAGPCAKVFAHNERKNSTVTDTFDRRLELEDRSQYEGVKRSNLTLSSRIQSCCDLIGGGRVRFSERNTSLRRRLCVPDFAVSLFVQRFPGPRKQKLGLSPIMFSGRMVKRESRLLSSRTKYRIKACGLSTPFDLSRKNQKWC
jgi:hypothetical protein